MKKIAFWVPEKQSHGMGHFQRSLSLKNYLTNQDISCFFCAYEPEYSISEKEDFLYFSKDLSAKEIARKLQTQDVGLLFIDNYFLPTTFINEICQDIQVGLFNYDNSPTNSVFHYNSNLYAQDFYTTSPSYQLNFFGPAYRPKLGIKKNNKKVYDYFLCFGAATPHPRINEVIDCIPEDQKVIFVLGPAADPNFTKSLIKRHHIEIQRNPNNFFDLFSSSKECLITASNLVYEAIELDLPMTVFSYVENHNQLAQYLKKESINVYDLNNTEDLRDIDLKGRKLSSQTHDIGLKLSKLVEKLKGFL